ncbi:exodeoxyribonuclease V subunit alpha [Shewanella psychromarinicola]|uniref:RecBCD enzyme subunit RecD n=1 Tax=Shewanella psychromarinicola TaxID=2487742 RepID=A0A3N4DKD6_9GAMM|nr:exodeoxyribonuclease V subunit alpha [Shewanella psychromarinicola]AZG35752.1 exodeoxyribonuclease V subunit alpha [Shewanella psychromarinicola]MCL1083953.1 exodeoxyribonuclease V subunit alpha [Shewanella psychromarinicola]RPA22661.1 exodeoxyribonuclease V subunit alpha [Shewanella psychromarinicola]
MLMLSHPITQLLQLWQQQRLITALDRHFALELANIETINNDPSITEAQSQLFLLICALLSQQLSNQHSCLVIDQIDLANPMAEDSYRHAEINCSIKLNHQQLIDQICLFDAVGQPGDNTPMIFEHGRLYLNKYHFFETQVAAKLTQLAHQPIENELTHTNLPQLIECLFAAEDSDNKQFNWQKIATATALAKALAVITGGPGTGKTTTVTKLLLLLLTQSALTIRLVAPTGKAAARLSESIKASKQRLLQELTQVSDPALAKILIDSLKQIPEEASTLHRLLGVIPNSHQFRHYQHNPLRLDLLVVDEASMVDLPMMYKLLSALPSHGRLILLGDQDQLASVEAGAVLADICVGLKQSSQANTSQWSMRYSAEQAKLIGQLTQQDVSQFIDPLPKMGDSLCMLMHSHRFKGDAGIGLLASAVNQSNVSAIRQVWLQKHAELNWFEHQHNALGDNSGKQALLTLSVQAYGEYLSLVQENQQRINQQTMLDQADVQDSVITLPHSEQTIIDSFNHYRVLCAMRAGEFGVEGMNIAITDSLKQTKLINPHHEFYLGRPIIIQSNDYNLGLFNGDIGLILQDSTKPSRLMAHFVMADGSLLKVLPARLPSHDTCYAMTVHKSQGSEFDKVSFVLPHKPSPAQWQLLSKELLYTAITRAKNHFYCLGTNMIFEKASKQATSRASGLAWRLWG